MGGGSARIDPAGVRRMLRLHSMHRRENDQGTQQGSDPGDPNSITSSTCSRRKFLSSHCLAGLRTRHRWAKCGPGMPLRHFAPFQADLLLVVLKLQTDFSEMMAAGFMPECI